MIINNKIFKLSSLCVIGALTFCYDRVMPSSSKETSPSENTMAQISSIESALDDDYSMAIGIDLKALSDEEIQNEFDKKTEEKKKEKVVSKLPNIEGLDGKPFDYEYYLKNGFAIAQVEKYVNIRKEPKSSSIVGTLANNAGCFVKKVVDIDGESWSLIESGKITGYVPSSCLITGEEAINYMTEVGCYVITVTSDDSLRVRSAPDGDVINKISKGEKLEVKRVVDGWVEVISDISDGESAYVSEQYVDISFEVDTAKPIESISGIGTSGTRNAIIKRADGLRGLPYKREGTSLTTGADCSGFVQAVYREKGISLPRTSREQARCGNSVSESELQPGDLVFYKNESGTVKHVAIYAGVINGKKRIIHSPKPGDSVKYSNMNYSSNRIYRRVIND